VAALEGEALEDHLGAAGARDNAKRHVAPDDGVEGGNRAAIKTNASESWDLPLDHGLEQALMIGEPRDDIDFDAVWQGALVNSTRRKGKERQYKTRTTHPNWSLVTL
jgi:hypothetical protein